MGIAQALYTGVTGLSINSDGMNVIANNIANANGKGFKKDRAEFADMLSSRAAGEAGLIGRGAQLRKVSTLFTPGGIKVTNNLTDIAIEGQGFIVLKSLLADSSNPAGYLFTRVGGLQFDRNGYLSDVDGARVQGYSADDEGNILTRLGDVRIETNSIRPHPTKEILMSVNLDSRNEIMEQEFDIARPSYTSNFSNTLTIFDSAGQAHQMTVFYRRVEQDEGIAWEWHATVDGKEVEGFEEEGSELFEFANGKVLFDNKGNLMSEETEQSEISFNNGAKKEQKIKFDFGKSIEEGGKGVNASTSIAAKSSTIFHQQDGYESGNLKSMKIKLDGRIVGVFTNGVERNLAALSLATFENQNGLNKAGNNRFVATTESGPAKIGLAQTGTRGSIFSSSLEESNVDLAEEFVNMIVTQRSFQANSRSVTTTDTMIEEVINMKR